MTAPSCMSPNCMSNNQHFKSWTDWATKFCLIQIFTWPLANQLLLLQVSQQLFSGKMLPQPSGCRKCFLRVCWILKHKFLCYRNKILIGKNVLIVMVPILINKDVFEPSYNGLNFAIWGCPVGLVVKNSLGNAGDTGVVPGPQRFHMLQRAAAEFERLETTTAEALIPWSLRFPTREATGMRSPHTTARE